MFGTSRKTDGESPRRAALTGLGHQIRMTHIHTTVEWFSAVDD